MYPRGRKPQDDVSPLDFLPAGQHIVLLRDPDRETRKIEVVGTVGIRHLGRLSAAEPAAGQLASAHNPAHQGVHPLLVDSPAGNVVQEDHRLCSADKQVIDVHGDKVDPDGVVDPEFFCHEELCPGSVRRGHQHG